MDVLIRIDIDIFSLIISGLILFDAVNGIAKQFMQYRLFIALLISNMALLALETVGWLLDGHVGETYAIVYTAINILFFIINPLPSFLWTLYTYLQIYHNESLIRKLAIPFTIPLLINAIMTLINPFTGLMFYLDENNFYHRGPLFILLVVTCYFYLIYTFILIFIKRNKIEKRYFRPLLVFAIPPTVGGIVQATHYGVALIWSGMTLSMLIVYHSIQNNRINTDYLTGIYNRMGFDQYLTNLIRNSSTNKTFSGILIDIDNFKGINDCYGHAAGDKVLKLTAELLSKSLGKDDFIARYGGDEFIVIINAQNVSELEKAVQKINACIKDYNLYSSDPFKLSLSIGYDVYDKSIMNEESFIKHIDTLMYQNKNAKLP